MPMIRGGRFRSVVRVLLPTVALMTGVDAWASCRIDKRWFVAQDVVMDMGQVVILPSTPIGGVIGELSNGAISQVNNVAKCDERGGFAKGEFVNANDLVPSAGVSVYKTAVEGVGIQVYRDSGTVKAYYPHQLDFDSNSVVSLVGGNFIVRLIKTADRTGTGLIAPSGTFTRYFFDGDTAIRPVLTSTFKGSGTTIVNPTCEVMAGSRNITVDFGAVPSATFTGVGKRSADHDFVIGLQCQGSNVDAYQNTIGIKLDAARDSSNQTGVLQLTQNVDRAVGIGIELVQVATSTEIPVDFGKSIPLGRTVAGTNRFSLPLRARYVQTVAGKVRPGTANGTATFTITYN